MRLISNLKSIGVYTSGGDAPGMNAAIRAVTRTALHYGIEVKGVLGGYPGLMKSDLISLGASSVANILQRGGTILKTGRMPEFHNSEVRSQAAAIVRNLKLDALVCIGGDGSFAAAHLLWTEHKLPVVCIPATIDNDIYATDFTVGFDTAVNTALDAIDRIRDTAASHDRLFIVEVMGRDSGFIAADVGVAGGAEEVFYTDGHTTVETAIEHIRKGLLRGKKSSILITAEGQKPGRAYTLAEQIRKKSGFEAKVCILGHIQRGGAPTARDRILASRFGAAAIEALRRGECDLMLASQGEQIVTVSLQTALSLKKKVNKDLLCLSQLLST